MRENMLDVDQLLLQIYYFVGFIEKAAFFITEFDIAISFTRAQIRCFCITMICSSTLSVFLQGLDLHLPRKSR